MSDYEKYEPVLPCVVCGSPDHEGYFDGNGERLLYVCCPNKDRPDVQERIKEIRRWEALCDNDPH